MLKTTRYNRAGAGLLACKKMLDHKGIYVMIRGSLSLIFKTNLFGWLLSFSSKKIRSLAAKPKQKDLEFIANLSNDGILKPVIEKYYPLDKTAEAVRYLLEGHAKGKVVIKMQQKIT